MILCAPDPEGRGLVRLWEVTHSNQSIVPESHCKMSVQEIWTCDIFQYAQHAVVSVAKLALVKKGDAQGGVKSGVLYWQRNLLSMYLGASQLTVSKFKRISVAADASRHSCKDYRVPIAYDPVNKAGAYFTGMYES